MRAVSGGTGPAARYLPWHCGRAGARDGPIQTATRRLSIRSLCDLDRWQWYGQVLSALRVSCRQRYRPGMGARDRGHQQRCGQRKISCTCSLHAGACSRGKQPHLCMRVPREARKFGNGCRSPCNWFRRPSGRAPIKCVESWSGRTTHASP